MLDDRNYLYIGGQWVTPASSARIRVVSATTEEAIGIVPQAAAENISSAAKIEAFDMAALSHDVLVTRAAEIEVAQGSGSRWPRSDGLKTRFVRSLINDRLRVLKGAVHNHSVALDLCDKVEFEGGCWCGCKNKLDFVRR